MMLLCSNVQLWYNNKSGTARVNAGAVAQTYTGGSDDGYSTPTPDFHQSRRSSFMGKIVDRVGERFGKLVVVRDAGRKFGGVLWECRCDCGRLVKVRASSLVCGDCKSCRTFGECYMRWEGGSQNIGSFAWIKKLMVQGRLRAEEEGHAAPVGDPRDVLEMWNNSRGICGICSSEPRKPRRLVLDHDHSSGAVRGFICGQCNVALGMVGDSPERLRQLAEYLEGNYRLSSDYEVRTA